MAVRKVNHSRRILSKKSTTISKAGFGDIILYHAHHNSIEYKLNGEDVLIMSQNEVLSIIKED